MPPTKKKNIRKAGKRSGLTTSNVVIVNHTVVPAKETSKLKKINEMLRNAKLQHS
jgi:hypothetical protein